MNPELPEYLQYLLALRNLLVFLAGAYVWKKSSSSTLSLRFSLVLAISAALATIHVLSIVQAFFEWIILKLIM
ncbi:hypothetical protein DM935_20930 [Salmonella enterica]|nr:hypothetical protein [Salmonella enterica]EBL8960209.1 hypothetical protein [Salmonella enterica]EBO4503060.1 hypothetical protein [Salmonella enterica]EEH4961081.1 hypothetical protein [Salmonella enterica subsp. enterica serovar Javiana]